MNAMNNYESRQLPAAAAPKINRGGAGEHEFARLLEGNDVERAKPPLARPENDENDETDDRQIARAPYPGVDDGFFAVDGDGGDVESDNPDVEVIQPRAGGDGEDRSDGAGKPRRPSIPSDAGDVPEKPQDNPVFPYAPGFAPGFGIDLEPGFISPDGSIPDVNVYQHKKTLAQGMMDLALFSANANQLRYVLESNMHPYFYPSLVMISISLIFQIAVGVGLIWNSRYNVKDKKQICIANKINNFTIIGIFLITVINVFISAFGVAYVPPATNP